MLTESGRRQGGIRRRMIAHFVPLCVLLLGVCAVGFLLAASLQIRIAEAGSTDTASLAAGYSEALLVEQGVQAAVHYADAKAESIRSQMQAWFTILFSLRDSTAALYSEQGRHPETALPHVVEAAAQGDILTMHYGLSPGVLEDEALRQELSFYAGLAPVWMATMEHAGQIGSLYMTTPSGINIGCDTNASGKLSFVTYEARDNAWYASARDSGGLYVSDAYQDSFGRGLTMTLSVPVHAQDLFLGVLSMDILIESINQDILQTQITGNGFALLTSWDGAVISPPEYAGRNIEDLLAGQSGVPGGSNVLTAEFDGTESYLVQREIDAIHWQLYLVLPAADIVAPAEQAVAGIGQIAQDTRRRMIRQLTVSVAGALLLFGALILTAAAVTRRTAARLADPIVRLCRDVEGIGEGDLHYICTLRTGDEIEQLGRAFQSMTGKLAAHIKELAEVTADRERIAAELNVATRIQTGMLPCIFPAFPHREEFDLYATMRPAREVGGDFYDFFLVGEDRLAMVIGDVSGKGVPAALFMVIAKTLIKNQCQMGLEPAQVLEEVNRQLCENNDAGLFVTVFLCVLEISTGRLDWANGGHNPPLVRSGGEWTYLDTEPGLVLAGMEDVAYRQENIRLQRGDMLLLYTDGVTESQNPQGELFSQQRLLNALRSTESECGARDTVEGVMCTALSFGGNTQLDDITVLSMQYRSAIN